MNQVFVSQGVSWKTVLPKSEFWVHKMRVPLIRLASAAANFDPSGINKILPANAFLLFVHIRSK